MDMEIMFSIDLKSEEFNDDYTTSEEENEIVLV